MDISQQKIFGSLSEKGEKFVFNTRFYIFAERQNKATHLFHLYTSSVAFSPVHPSTGLKFKTPKSYIVR